jgi:hypothetical protein
MSLDEPIDVDGADEWPGSRARPAWVRWVALVAAAALVLPLVVAAVDLVL